MRISVFDLDGKEVGYQERLPGKQPKFQPWGLRAGECQPYIERLTGQSKLLTCEGPSDAVAAGKLDCFSSYDIIGCWASGILPPIEWWRTRSGLRLQTVVSCGDADDAGKAFNQRIANAVGICYPIAWPRSRPAKWDLKDEIEKQSPESAYLLAEASLLRSPLIRLEKQIYNAERTYTNKPGIILKLVEAAGGRYAHKMGGNRYKFYCPLHDDREDASLTVDDDTGSFMCWAGCGSGGPVQFLMASKGLKYDDALELLRKYV